MDVGFHEVTAKGAASEELFERTIAVVLVFILPTCGDNFVRGEFVDGDGYRVPRHQG